MPPSPEAEFFNQHLKHSPKLSADASKFMMRLLLKLEELPWAGLDWAVGYPVECVFEDSRGEVQVCINRRHLHFSEEREKFIREYITDGSFNTWAEQILCEWVRASANGPWREKNISLELERKAYGVFAILLSSETVELEDGDIKRNVKKRELVFTSGMHLAPHEDLAERALAEGERAVLIQFPEPEDVLRNEAWIAALRRRYRGAEILVGGVCEEVYFSQPGPVPVFPVGSKVIFRPQ